MVVKEVALGYWFILVGTRSVHPNLNRLFKAGNVLGVVLEFGASILRADSCAVIR